ncbi:MAG: EAL domain-containing protein [Rhizobiaceae bacterium]|nr:EAL domain-containing protein [Rhizobiaceae bacterium]
MDSEKIMSRIGQASYVWDLTDDALTWSDNFVELIGFKDAASLGTGRDFETMLSAESPETRYGTVLTTELQNPPKEGVAYQCLYAVNATNTTGSTHVWLEDTGRWYPSDSGRPAYAEGIVRIANERRQHDEELKRKSGFDDLTGLPNRRVLEEMLDKVATDCFTNNKSAVFLLFSLEHLDLINATYGYEAGDETLKKVGEIIQSTLRGDDLVARFSSAKFGIVLCECGDREVFIAAKRFQAAVEKNVVETRTGPVAVRAATGFCLLPKHATNAVDALSAAMTALHEAKDERGFRMALYNPDPDAVLRRRKEAQVLTNVMEAIDVNRMHLAFQPVVDAQTHRVTFHEALLRMEEKNGSVSIAADFIGVAEKLGLIKFIDHYALNLTLKALADYPDAKLSLNVSHETAKDPEWISNLASGLKLIPDASERLIVEITESHAASNILEAQKFVNTIHEMGCKVAIDDFGAGYTSFSNLKDLQIDIIKVDGSFCADLENNRQNQIFIRALLDLANAFDVKIVVEWVESAETAALLAKWGVDYLQGAAFGMPLPVAPWDKVEEEDESNDKQQKVRAS